jgi:hypothetical protein
MVGVGGPATKGAPRAAGKLVFTHDTGNALAIDK